MSWGEALRLMQMLIDDPGTRIASALAGHKRPWSHEWAAMVDLYDAFVNANFPNAKPYPRPWPDPRAKRHGRTDKSRAEVISILNAHGHKIAG